MELFSGVFTLFRHSISGLATLFQIHLKYAVTSDYNSKIMNNYILLLLIRILFQVSNESN
jgi:hypothetical protein